MLEQRSAPPLVGDMLETVSGSAGMYRCYCRRVVSREGIVPAETRLHGDAGVPEPAKASCPPRRSRGVMPVCLSREGIVPAKASPQGDAGVPGSFAAKPTPNEVKGLVSREGIEPSTRRLRVCCSAN